MPAYQHVKVPANGAKITVNPDYSISVPDNPIIPYIEGDGTGLRHHAGDDQGRRRGGGQGVRRQAEDPLDGNLRGREVHEDLRSRRLAARRIADHPQGLRRVDQGAADDARRRRDPFAQRGAAPAARPVRVPAARPLLQGRAVAGQGAREDRHGDLPREFRGHLRRHRVAGGNRRRQESHRLPDQGDGRQEDPLPGDVVHRHQARVARRHRTARAQGAAVHDRQRPQVDDARAQGQHHEVHRGRLPRLGLRARARRSSARSSWTAGRGCRSRIRRPAARSSSRT